MLLRTLVISTFTLISLTTMSCHLYIDDGDEPRGGPPPGDCGRLGCETSGNGPDAGRQGVCETNEECGPGCYCDEDGSCIETSICEESIDCGEDFECDERDSCVPLPEPEPFACPDLNTDEAACISHGDCGPVYRGVNCTSETGEQCTGESTDCVCESFTFDRCELL